MAVRIGARRRPMAVEAVAGAQDRRGRVRWRRRVGSGPRLPGGVVRRGLPDQGRGREGAGGSRVRDWVRGGQGWVRVGIPLGRHGRSAWSTRCGRSTLTRSARRARCLAGGRRACSPSAAALRPDDGRDKDQIQESSIQVTRSMAGLGGGPESRRLEDTGDVHLH